MSALESPPVYTLTLPPLRGSKRPILHVLAPWGSPDRSPLPQRRPKNEREAKAMAKSFRRVEVRP